MDWKTQALLDIRAGKKVHGFILGELVEAGLIHFAVDTENILFTAEGTKLLLHANSADYASKRYD